MTTEYRVYANGGSGGPVDYSTAIATVSGLSYSPSPLADDSDWTFAVRAFDAATGLEESNIDARVRVAVGATGADVSATPSTPTLLGLRARAGGSCRVDWVWIAAPGSSPATGFAVYLTAGSSVSYATPAATVSAVPGLSRYSATLTGLADGVAYVVAVRAVNASGHDAGTSSLPVVGSSVPPASVDGLSAVATIVPRGLP